MTISEKELGGVVNIVDKTAAVDWKKWGAEEEEIADVFAADF